MSFDNDDHKDGVSRRHALERMIWASGGVLWLASGGLKSMGQISSAHAATAMAQAKATIPIIVKDKTSFYWQAVLAGARKAGQDLGVNVVELGAELRNRCQWPDRHSGECTRVDAGRHRHRPNGVHRTRQAD